MGSSLIACIIDYSMIGISNHLLRTAVANPTIPSRSPRSLDNVAYQVNVQCQLEKQERESTIVIPVSVPRERTPARLLVSSHTQSLGILGIACMSRHTRESGGPRWVPRLRWQPRVADLRKEK